MLIRCDGCGQLIQKTLALPVPIDEDEVALFCSEACRAKGRLLPPLDRADTDPTCGPEATTIPDDAEGSAPSA